MSDTDAAPEESDEEPAAPASDAFGAAVVEAEEGDQDG